MIDGFVFCPGGDIVDNGLLDKKNFYHKSDQEVHRILGFNGGDQFVFVVPISEETLKEDLLRVDYLHKKIQKSFLEYAVLSLANSTNYTSDGELGIPHIDLNLIKSSDWDKSNWKKQVGKDFGIFGFLIGKNFDYAEIMVFVGHDYSEKEIRNRIASLVEDRDIPEWEWRFFKKDVYPTGDFEGVLVSGWSFGRGLMDAVLSSDIITLTGIALVCSTLINFLLLGSFRQALYCSIVIALSLYLARGIVGLLYLSGFEFLGEPVKERVYMVLIFAASIIASISFSTRKINSYNEQKDACPDLSRSDIWDKTKLFNGKIYIVALIAIPSFILLHSIMVRGISEMGIVSACVIFCLVGLTKWLIPAMQVIAGGESRRNSWKLKLGEVFLRKSVESCYWVLTRFSPKKTFKIAVLLSFTFILGAGLIISHDYYAHYSGKTPIIETGTKAIYYLRDTLVDRTRKFLNQLGRGGFGSLFFLIQSDDKEADIYNPEFIRRFYDLQQEAAKIEGVRSARSIIDTALVICRNEYGKPFPTKRQEVMDIFSIIAMDLDRRIVEQFWYEGGVRLTLMVDSEDSLLLFKQAKKTVELFDPDSYSFFKCLPFGRDHIYHQVDEYIRSGQLGNMANSSLIIFIGGLAWVIIRRGDLKNSGQKYFLNAPVTALAMVVPFVFACSCIVYLMAIFRIPLDQSMACFTPLAINAAVDFNLHFVDDFNQALTKGSGYKESLRVALCEKGKINIVDIVINAFCFSFLTFSNFPPIALLGWLLVVMMFACGFGALIIMPAILYKCIESNNQLNVQA